MKNSKASWAAAIAALTCVGPLQAHHSIGMFDVSTPIWVKGTVVRYERVNPHAMITLEEAREDGRVQRWTVEGPAPRLVDLRGSGPDFLHVGDVIEVCAFALKKDPSARREYRDADGSSARFVHGHVLVMPDGRMRLWGSYGKLGECISSTDERRESWLRFLNTGPMAREVWCSQRKAAIQSTASSRAFVEEINALMTHPCE